MRGASQRPSIGRSARRFPSPALPSLLTLLTLLPLSAAAPVGCGEPELGELPARCSAGACPEGYDCIHGVCAKPGTPIPITVAALPALKAGDLRVVPQASTVLVTWQTYAYSAAGQRFVGARVSPAGVVSQEITLVSSFVADEGATEPLYDVLRVSDDTLLIAVSAPPLAGDPLPEPRLITYEVELPLEGREADGAQFGSPWNEEMRMSTIGYGAVSRPKLVARDGRVELGYFRTRTDTSSGFSKTIGELVVVGLDNKGALLPGDPKAYLARDGLPVAVGVIDAFQGTTGAWWVLDNVRPSVLLITNEGTPVEAKLERLGAPGAVEGASLFYVRPSARTGEKLPSGPVAGAAALYRVDHGIQVEEPTGGTLTGAALGEMPEVRDTPRPVWIQRAGKPAVMVTPGKELTAGAIQVLTVDTATGSTKEAARVERFSTSNVDGLAAAIVNGQLFVAWVDGAEETSTIRMAIVPEP